MLALLIPKVSTRQLLSQRPVVVVYSFKADGGLEKLPQTLIGGRGKGWVLKLQFFMDGLKS